MAWISFRLALLWEICSLYALERDAKVTAAGSGPEWMQLMVSRPPLVIWYVQPSATLLVPVSVALVQVTAPLPSLITSCPSFCMA